MEKQSRNLRGTTSRLVSLVLAIALVVSMLSGLPVLAKAADGAVNIKLHFHNKWSWTTPAVQYWGGTNTTVSGYAAGPEEISGWGGVQGYTMTKEGNWYTLTLTGDFTGFQFLDMANPASGNTGGWGYSSYMAAFTGDTATDLYMQWSDDGSQQYWYTDEACTQELGADVVPTTYTYTVHFSNPGGWTGVCAYAWDSLGNTLLGSWPGTTAEVNADNSGWYTVEFTNTEASVNVIFNGSGGQTGDLSVSVPEGETSVEAWITEAVSYTAPEGWVVPFNGYDYTIHFSNPYSWGAVNAYAWLADGTYFNGAWPGSPATAETEYKGWYTVEFTIDETSANVIFNDGSGNQTNDLSVAIPEGETSVEVWVTGLTAADVIYTAPASWDPNYSVYMPEVGDTVKLQWAEGETEMLVYTRGVYEGCIASETEVTATVVVNGEAKELTATGTPGSNGCVYFRLKDGVLSAVTPAPASLVGSFTGLSFKDENGKSYTLGNWNPADELAELDYIGGGLYGRTFTCDALTEDVSIEYKVAFNDNWDYSIGNGGSNVSVTIPAGTDHLTILMDEIGGVIWDSVRSADFSVPQNGGAANKPALDTVISLIGTIRGGVDDWTASTMGWEFTQISENLFRFESDFAAGSYAYKCVFDYSIWYEAEAGNRNLVLDDTTHVIFLYDAKTGLLYDSVNNAEDVAIYLGLKAAPPKMEVRDNPNGTTAFIALGNEGDSVVLYYGSKADVESGAALTEVILPNVSEGKSQSADIFFGDEALDIIYYYEIAGVKTLDASNPTVEVNGVEYSNYTRDVFTGRIVNVAGTFPGPSWDATSNVMTYLGNGLYVYTFETVSAGSYQYKIAFNSWDPENYGAGGVDHGDNISVTVPHEQSVSVYYNDFTHYAVTTVDYIFADIALVGTGIPEDTKLTDNGLTGIYSVTVYMEAGTYTDVKILYNGQEYVFAEIVLEEGKAVTFYMDPVTLIYYCDAANDPVDADRIYYNTQIEIFKSIYGAVPTGEPVDFAIQTGGDVTGAVLVVKGVGSMPMAQIAASSEGDLIWSVSVTFNNIGELDYYFVLTNGSSVVTYGDDDGYYGAGKVSELTNVMPYDLVVYQSGYETPDWMKNAVIYQIFPDRFFDAVECNNQAQTSARGTVDYEYVSDWYAWPENPEQETQNPSAYPENAYWGDGEWSNEIYGGDLQGIIERIDYLKALGVNVIYLNPVFSSISNHRYDACDYTVIDPILGTMGDFEELVAIAEANDMHIILDGVFNHVSDDSVYFDRYYKFLGQSAKIGAYPYWAYVYDAMAESGLTQEEAEAAAKAHFTAEYGITDYSYTEWFEVYTTYLTATDGTPVTDSIGLRAGKPVYGYQGWWGYDSMPVIKSTNGSEYQTGNWAEEIIYNEDGTSVTQYWISEGNNGWRLDVANEVSDETWQNFRASVKALDSDAVIIGEIWEDATKYLMGDMYDSVMNYEFRRAVLGFTTGTKHDNSNNAIDVNYTAADAVRDMERLRERYPEEAFYAMMNLVDSHDTSRVLSYLDGILDDRLDKTPAGAYPTYENTSDWAKDAQYLVAFLQFTYAGAPTIYYGDEIGMVGSDDPDDRRTFEWGMGNEELVTWYATLASIRSQYTALRTGSVEFFLTYDDVLSYVRRDESDALIVLANSAATAHKITLNLAALDVTAETLTDLVSGTVYTVVDGSVTVTVSGQLGVILTENAKECTVDQENLKPAFDPAYIVADRDADSTKAHSYETTTVEATCTEDGAVIHTCVYCGDTWSEVIPATGEHAWDEGVVTTEATCVQDGVKTYTCGVCGETRTEVIPASGAHEWDEGTVTKAPTCTAEGEIVYTCLHCDASKSEPIAALDCPSVNFTDVKPGAWYHDSVDYMVTQKLMVGMSATNFGISGTLTRAQMVAILYRIAGEPTTEGMSNPFTDVAENAWYAAAVTWGYNVGVVAGMTDTTFAPNAPVTRQQMVSFLYRFEDAEAPEEDHLAAFADASKVQAYAYDAMNWAVANGLINGVAQPGGPVLLDPTGTATRAQTAVFFTAYLKKD